MPHAETVKLAEERSATFQTVDTKGKSQENNKPSDLSMFSFLKDWDRKALFYLVCLAFVVRLAFLHHPSVVVFDEVHFGGFAQKYLTGQFFLDLHPPLARLLVTLSAWVGGFDGKFTFYNIGADYIRPNVPYIMMRAFTATLGALVVPMAYITMRGMGLTEEICASISTMIIFENGLVTQSRLILLDSYLVFFTAATAMFWVLFRHMSPAPFTTQWKLALLGTGACMALAASCKWVGLFLVAGVGIFTVSELWGLLGDTSVPISKIGRHFVSRSVGLIFLPLSIYTLTFYPHFAMQRNFNPGASGMSIEYQQTLDGGQTPPCPKNVHFGAFVRLRQYRSAGPFLHSHQHMYPAGSKQQQVTGYHHRDQNNVWLVRRSFQVNSTYVDESLVDEHKELVPLRHGDSIRLEHVSSGRFLHSHAVEPPVSSKDHHFEVSAYGHNPGKFSDLNDNWLILLTDKSGTPYPVEEGAERPQITAMSRFRLFHTLVHCSLMTGGKSLPEWGFKQNEITCSREAKRKLAIWSFEANEHPLVDMATAEMISYKTLGFFGKFLELNKKMWQTNAGLSADHPFASRPMSWPMLSRGLGFWNGNHVPDTEKIHRLKEDTKNGLKQAKPKQLVEVDEEGNVIERDPASAQAQADDDLTEADKLEHAQLAQDTSKFKGCQIYLIGNPLFWWATTAAVIAFVATLFVYRLASRRGLPLAKAIASTTFGSNLTIQRYGGFMFLQWLFHFLPFFAMQRQLFLHHYLPGLYFAVMLLALLLETVVVEMVEPVAKRLLGPNAPTQKIRRAILFTLTAAVVLTFVRFAPLGYGFSMSKTQCTKLKWLARWDFDCDGLPDPIKAAIITTPADL